MGKHGQAKMKNEMEAVFADDLQILALKIITCKPSLKVEAKEQLRHQYSHQLQDPYYAAIAQGALQISDNTKSFTQFCGYLAMTLSGHSRFVKTSSHISGEQFSSFQISEQ